MQVPTRENFSEWFVRMAPCAALAAAPVGRIAVASGRHQPIALSELLWALGAIVIWSSVIGACFAFARARRRRAARERIQSVQVTRYVDLTRKSSAAASKPGSER